MIVFFLKVLKFSNMFRSIFDHPQGDIFFFFTSVTRDKIIWFAVACLVWLLLYSNNQTKESTQQHQHKAQQV